MNILRFWVSFLTSGIISEKKSDNKSEKRARKEWEKSEINIGMKKWDVNIIGL